MKRILITVFLAALLRGCGSQQSGEQGDAMSPADSDLPKRNYVAEGVQHLRDADVMAAIQSFDSAIKQDPTNPETYIILGQTYMNLQQYNRAIDSFLAATRVAPQEGELYYLLSINHRLAGNMKEAKAYAEKSIDIFRDNQDELNFKKSLVLLQSLVDEGNLVK